MTTIPAFPPLLTGHPLPPDALDPARLREGALAETWGGGDFLWTCPDEHLQFALMLEPEVTRIRCAEILPVAMVAIGDAIGALAPPEVSVTCGWPGTLMLNEADFATCTLLLPDTAPDTVPDWMILCCHIALLPPEAAPEPGHRANRTSLRDEGCGHINPIDLLESISRHLVSAIHTWSTDGFVHAHARWWERRSHTRPLPPDMPGTLTGLDEHGSAIIRHGDATTLHPIPALR